MCEASLEKQPESSEIGWGGTEEAPSAPGGSFKAKGVQGNSQRAGAEVRAAEYRLLEA